MFRAIVALVAVALFAAGVLVGASLKKAPAARNTAGAASAYSPSDTAAMERAVRDRVQENMEADRQRDVGSNATLSVAVTNFAVSRVSDSEAVVSADLAITEGFKGKPDRWDSTIPGFKGRVRRFDDGTWKLRD